MAVRSAYARIDLAEAAALEIGFDIFGDGFWGSGSGICRELEVLLRGVPEGSTTVRCQNETV